ncbi:urea transporter [Weeksella virosa]|uniref:Urea transporter n=1 Tax=Weeksella virosa (strain ATCC 43766 / DSM 16922 / JCM 21250 / CCUG 30538 / CDC 9751 / IAM 14551 / NBRC 16016 / NCTC 11634 / CL345/78) TaxID=865938 RepID=F0P2S1_WEEVC|nr:urea transporter [Weeksella virosa]ADX66811.1 Urea transporter [Weeksella virosa DSM 16922]VEH63465.1 Urea transporter [Weeksella virosa]
MKFSATIAKLWLLSGNIAEQTLSDRISKLIYNIVAVRWKLDTKNELAGKVVSAMSVLLKGYGQIMLQENSITGLLFLIGIFYGSSHMGFASLLAVVCGTVTAIIFKYPKAEIDKGLYGFSAALVGVAVALFLKPALASWVFIMIGSALATVLQHFFMRRKIPVFTLPFVVITWLILFISNNYSGDLLAEPALTSNQANDHLATVFRGFGQVIFQGSIVSGILFFIAVFISSRISALYGLFGAIISSLIAFGFSAPINDIGLGLYGYNAVLCAIVFAGRQFRDGLLALIAVFVSLGISLLMSKFDFPQLTFPFVLASCITLLFKTKTKINYKSFKLIKPKK